MLKVNALILSQSVNVLTAAQLTLLAQRPTAGPTLKRVILEPIASQRPLQPQRSHVLYWKDLIDDPVFEYELDTERLLATTDAQFLRYEAQIDAGKTLLEQARSLELELDFVLRCGERLLQNATTDVRQRGRNMVGFTVKKLEESEDGQFPSPSGSTGYDQYEHLASLLGPRGGYGPQNNARSRLPVIGLENEGTDIGIARGFLAADGAESSLSRLWNAAPNSVSSLSGIHRLWAEYAAQKSTNVKAFVGIDRELAKQMLSEGPGACLFSLPDWTALVDTADENDGPFDASPTIAHAIDPGTMQAACAAVYDVGHVAIKASPESFEEAQEEVDELLEVPDETAERIQQLEDEFEDAGIAHRGQTSTMIKQMTDVVKEESFPWSFYAKVLDGETVAYPEAMDFVRKMLKMTP